MFGDETVVFDFFDCYVDDDAVESAGNDAAVFSALGQVSRNGETASVVITAIERVGVPVYEPVYEVVFVPDLDSRTGWWGDTTEDSSETIDGSIVTFSGDFQEVLDGSTPSGQLESGSLDAACAS